jgi:L-malate glycosyltransferase
MGQIAVRPIRVAFVLHAMQVAGAEVLVAETIRRLSGQIEPIVLCLDAVGPLGERLLARGVPVVCLHRRPGRDWGVAWRLARELRQRRIEVIHAHQYTPFFYAALARLLSGLRHRLIFTEHGRHYPDLVSTTRRTVNWLALRHLASTINACCVFSAHALTTLDGFTGRPVEVIENGIEIDRYAPASDRNSLRQALGLSPHRRYLACVARFHPVKDHPTLIRGFATVARQRPDVDLLLVGDGELRADLEKLVFELEITDRVRFLGVRSDVPDLLRAVDVFALTSVSEAASLTVLEAMASRLPVVLTGVGGNPEMVRMDREGLLVPRGNAPAFTAALLRVLDDPALAQRFGEAGRRRVEERYLLAQTVEQYRLCYVRLTGRDSLREVGA